MNQIERVKVLLGIEDTLQDNLLGIIEELTEDHFKAYTGSYIIPDDLTYIITEVMVKRFNRIGSEGYSSKGVEGLTMTFNVSDFDEYDVILRRQFKPTFGGGFKLL